MLVWAPLPVVSFLLAPGAFLLLAKVTIALASDSTAFVLIDSNLSVELPESLSPLPPSKSLSPQLQDQHKFPCLKKESKPMRALTTK